MAWFTANAGLIAAISGIATTAGLVFVAWQIWLATVALRTQKRATDLQIYIDLNTQFLQISSKFREHINDPNITLSQLEPEERRAIDNWFYLASMEYVLYREGLSETLSRQWLGGIRSAASRKVFVERWRSTASKFTVDDGFRAFFEEASTSTSKTLAPADPVGPAKLSTATGRIAPSHA